MTQSYRALEKWQPVATILTPSERRGISFYGQGRKKEKNMGKRILICDDADLMRYVLKEILTEAGYEIVGLAKDGEEGLVMYEETEPDLVIVDITMPKVDGLEVMKKIKDKSPDFPVVICSASGQPNMVVDALKAGADDFIIKPFHGKRVLEVVEGVIGTP